MQPSGERLGLLYRVSQTFNSSLDLDQVLSYVMDEVIAATRAERGFLMLYDPMGRLAFRAARGMDQQTIESPEFQISRGVVERVARERRPVLTSNAQSDEWLGGRTSIIGLGLRSILCVPIQLKGATQGVIYVDNRLQAGIFTEDDLDLLTAIASSAAIAIENARLYQVALDKGRMERELEVARQVQSTLIPSQTPDIPGWQLAAWWQPAREVSGDFYDFVVDSQGRVGLTIGDVADKGMPAALFMALSRSTIRASVSQAPTPAEGIGQANRLICADAGNGMFVTVFYGRLDPATSDMTYVCAGHYPPLWYCAAHDRIATLELTGMALGILESFPYQQREVHLGAGDWVLLYTDGVTDATDGKQAFGPERLRRFAFEKRHAPAGEILGALEGELRDFVGTTAPFDDIAVVLAKRV